MFTGGFGPIHATQLTGLFTDIVTRAKKRLVNAQLRDVQYRGGHYYAIVETHVRDRHNHTSTTFYGVTTDQVPHDATGYFTVAGQTPVFVWQHPADPLLPGLRLAATPAQVRQHFVPQRELTALQTVIYRPMNRAVFKATLAPQTPSGPSQAFYLKVLRKNTAQQLYTIHQRLWSAGIPVVKPVAAPVTDILALEEGRGMPLGEYIRNEGAYNRFKLRQLAELLDRLPIDVMRRPQQPSWADRYQEFLTTAHQAMPESQAELTLLAAQFDARHATLELGPLVPTHGDLYEAHILVDPITGSIQHLLDVDGVGPGYRVDDYACLIGHLAVLGATEPQHWGWQAALRTYQQIAQHVDPSTLAVRAAAVVISLIPSYQPDPSSQARGKAYLRVAQGLMALT